VRLRRVLCAGVETDEKCERFARYGGDVKEKGSCAVGEKNAFSRAKPSLDCAIPPCIYVNARTPEFL